MKALIPAAGVGTRLRPITNTQPKALIQVADRPIIGHILEELVRIGVSEVVLVVGYLGHMVLDYARREFPSVNTEFVEQKELEGLGHALWLARERIGEEELIIIYGDTIVEGDLLRGINREVDGCLGVKRVEDPSRFCVVVTEGERIVRLVEKPEEFVSDIALVGVSFFRNAAPLFGALDTLVKEDRRTRGEIQATDAFQLMVERGAHLATFPVDNWFDCGKPETLLATNHHLLAKLDRQPEGENSVFIPPVFVAPTAEVRDSVLGPNVTVAEGARVSGCVLKDCIVNQGAVVEGALLASSIIGSYAHVSFPPQQLILGDYTDIASPWPRTPPVGEP